MLKTSVKLSDDETIIKDYHAANIKKPSKGEAHLILTNKRVIIDFHTDTSVLVNDLHIKEVRGADVVWSTARRRKLGIAMLIVGIAVIAFGFITTIGQTNTAFTMFISFVLPGIPIMVLGIFFIKKIKTTFIIVIHSKSITDSLAFHNLSSNALVKGMQESGIRIKLDGTPGPDAELMANEIGVIILDIQSKAKHETEVL